MKTEKKITINDIAKEAGVSRSLVSSVLTNMQNGKQIYRVSKETTAKIQEIMVRHNYHPNFSARALRKGDNPLIGVILSDISNRFFAVVSRSIDDYAQKKGFMAIFGNTDEKAEKLAESIELFYNKGVQGFIIVPCVGCEDTIRHYRQMGVPIVLLDRDFQNSGLSSVTIDNMGAARQLTQRLIMDGHKKIELVSYDTSLWIINEREAGYREEMIKNGLEKEIRIHRPEYCNYSQIESIIIDAHKRGVEALVFTTYRVAMLGRKATLKNRIVSQCAFACFNNADTFDIYENGMYYVEQPIDDLATHAVDLLIRRLKDNHSEEQKIILPPRIETTELMD